MFQARDLPLLAVFAAVARQGSFTAAARQLELSKSVVSDHIRTLEQRCSARLIERSTRRMRLTQVGEQVLEVAATVVGAARDVEAILEEHREALVGTLRVATTHDLGTRLVAPLLARLAGEHPQLRIDLVCDDVMRDLIGDRFDVAVRLGAPRDSEFIMRKLGSFGEPIVGAPELAASHPGVTRPRDLAGAPWVRHALVSRGQAFRFRGPRGQTDEIAADVRAQGNSGDSVRALLVGGVGFGVLPQYQIAEDLRRGSLVDMCPGWSWKQASLYALLSSPMRQQPRRVRLFLDALVQATKGGARQLTS